MPYLTSDRKRELDEEGALPVTPGDLTYLFTRAVIDPGSVRQRLDEILTPYLEGLKEPRYADLCEVIGALHCTAYEALRRRGHARWAAERATEVLRYAQNFYDAQVAPYEDKKIRQNGDVF